MFRYLDKPNRLFSQVFPLVSPVNIMSTASIGHSTGVKTNSLLLTSEESPDSDAGDTDDDGHGPWRDPHYSYSPPALQNSPPPTNLIPATTHISRPLIDARCISIPETENLLRDLREDFGNAALTWQGRAWRPTNLDELDSMSWARIQGRTRKLMYTPLLIGCFSLSLLEGGWGTRCSISYFYG